MQNINKNVDRKIKIKDPLQSSKRMFLRQNVPGLPALAVFQTISDQLPLQESVQNTLLSIFNK
jgi:hypothetical protein